MIKSSLPLCAEYLRNQWLMSCAGISANETLALKVVPHSSGLSSKAARKNMPSFGLQAHLIMPQERMLACLALRHVASSSLRCDPQGSLTRNA